MIRHAFSKLRRRMERNHLQRAAQLAHERYQICEHGGMLWLMFDGVRVLPESMLAKSALEILQDIRMDYIKDHTKKEEYNGQ